MKNTLVFQNTWALQQLPATLKLTGPEWRFLLCADGKTTVEQIQRRLGLSDPERDRILAHLGEARLLTETTLSLEDHARSLVDVPSPGAEPRTLTEFLQGTEPVEPPRETSIPTFRPLQKPAETAPHRSLSLQAVIQFILNQNPDPTAGQLSTYQVFMGINTQLLKRNGITSLRFQDDRFITDPELQAAIAENIQATLGIPVPEHLYSGQG